MIQKNNETKLLPKNIRCIIQCRITPNCTKILAIKREERWRPILNENVRGRQKSVLRVLHGELNQNSFTFGR